MVPEDDSRRFNPEFTPDLGRGVVPQLMRMPAVGLSPLHQLLPVLRSQSLLPLRVGLPPAIQRLRSNNALASQGLGRWKRQVAGPFDRATVGIHRVMLLGLAKRLLLAIGARLVSTAQGSVPAQSKTLPALGFCLRRAEEVRMHGPVLDEFAEDLHRLRPEVDSPLQSVMRGLVLGRLGAPGFAVGGYKARGC